MKTVDQNTGKRHKIFQDLIDSGRCTVRRRLPLPDDVKKVIFEEIAQHKELIRKGKFFRKYSRQRFGE